jgi:hypothetical protein
VTRAQVERNLNAPCADWCERVAERIYENSVDSLCQTVMPNLQQQGWQRRPLDWQSCGANDQKQDRSIKTSDQGEQLLLQATHLG